jgi:Fe-S-cluster-containing dehydrogenase component
VEACPTGAYSQRKGGGVRVKKSLCIHCGDCAEACPVDAIYLDATDHPFVCIHCGRCVDYCPHDCLELTGVADDSSNEGNNLSKEQTLTG